MKLVVTPRYNCLRKHRILQDYYGPEFDEKSRAVWTGL